MAGGTAPTDDSSAYQLHLGGRRRGRIWSHKPQVAEDGLLAVIHDAVLAGVQPRAPSNLEFRVVVWDENGHSFAAADEKGQVYVFQVFRNVFSMVKTANVPIGSMSFVPNTKGRDLLIGTHDGTVMGLDTTTREAIATLRGEHDYPVHSLSPHPHRHSFLSGSRDGIVVWATRDRWQKVRSLNVFAHSPNSGGVAQASFGSMGDKMIVLMADGTLLIWDSLTFTLESRLVVPCPPASSVTGFCPSYDGLSLVASDNSGALYLFDLPGEALVRIAQLPPSSTAMRQLRTDAGGKYIMALTGDGRVLFLEFDATQCAVAFEIYCPLQGFASADLDPTARYLVCCLTDATLRIYDLDPRKHAADARSQTKLLPSRSPYSNETSGMSSSLQDSSSAARLPRPSGSSMLKPKPSSDIVDVLFGGAAAKTSAKEAALDLREGDGEGPGALEGKKSKKGKAKGSQHSGSSAGRWQWESLYRLITEDPNRSRLSVDKLRSLLSSYNCFPARYRLLIWKFLLRLPENTVAFKTLTDMGPHPAFNELESRYPLKSEGLLRRLQTVCSALGHWSPIFGEVEYLPVVAFPFVQLFKGDDLAAFETTMCILLHWHHNFLSTFPSAPVTILSTLEQLLKTHDPALRRHFIKIQLDAQGYGWTLLRSIFTEVLTREEWLQLWDFLFAWADRPEFLLFAVIAYVIQLRRPLMSIDNKAQAELYFHKQNPVSIPRLVASIHRLVDATPVDFLSALRRRAGLGSDGRGSDDQQTTSLQTNTPVVVLPSSAEDPWPIPVGHYPMFEGYPKYVVDYQIRERARIAVEEEEIKRKRQFLEELTKRSEELNRAEQLWQAEKKIMLESEEKRRQEAAELHAKRMGQLKMLDEEARARRLMQMSDMEKGAEKSLEVARRLRETEQQRLKDEMERITQKTDYDIRAREEEERVLNLERQVQERMAESMTARYEEDRLREMRAEIERRRELFELEDRRLKQKWAEEDAEREAKIKALQAKREKMQRLEGTLKTQSEMDQAFLTAQIERETKLAAIERARRIRRLEEEQVQVKEAETIARIKEAEAERKEDIIGFQEVIRKFKEKDQESKSERWFQIEQEQRRATLEAEMRMRRLSEMEKAARRRELEEKLLAEREKELDKALAEEKGARELLLDLEKDRLKARSHELKMMLSEEEKKAMAEFQSALQTAESRILSEERRRYETMRDDLRAQSAAAEADTLARHERRLHELEAQRAREVREMESELQAKTDAAHRRGPSAAQQPGATSDSSPEPPSRTRDRFTLSTTSDYSPSEGIGGGGAAPYPSGTSRPLRPGILESSAAPSLEQALNLGSEGGGSGSEGDVDSVESVVKEAAATIARHRKLTAERIAQQSSTSGSSTGMENSQATT